MNPSIDHAARPMGPHQTRRMESGVSTNIVSEVGGKGRRSYRAPPLATSSLMFRAYMAWFKKGAIRL